MPVDKSFVGRTGGQARIVVERGPVGAFARAVKSTDPVFTDERAAKQAGFDSIPAPPTFLIAAPFWGAFPEQQPEGAEPNPVGEVVAQYARDGGLLLHGEQAFTYHRPIFVGDVLDVETTIVDVYEKESGSSTMTFTVAESTFRNATTGDVVATTRSNFINRR